MTSCDGWTYRRSAQRQVRSSGVVIIKSTKLLAKWWNCLSFCEFKSSSIFLVPLPVVVLLFNRQRTRSLSTFMMWKIFEQHQIPGTANPLSSLTPPLLIDSPEELLFFLRKLIFLEKIKNHLNIFCKARTIRIIKDRLRTDDLFTL